MQTLILCRSRIRLAVEPLLTFINHEFGVPLGFASRSAARNLRTRSASFGDFSSHSQMTNDFHPRTHNAEIAAASLRTLPWSFWLQYC
jgi:hypothetical protein